MTSLAPNSRLALALAAILVASPASGQDASETATDAVDGRSPAHTHIHHVAVAFRGTPDDQGLLATAVAEAEVAHQHATFAMRDPTDLASVRRHLAHVLHALDPSTVEEGPGLGYGAIRAAERTAHYISLASASDGVTDAIETHSTHIAAAAGHAMTNGEAALELANEILAATVPPEEEGDTGADEGDDEEGDDEEGDNEAGDDEAGDDEAGGGEEDDTGADERAEEDPPQEEAEEPLDVPAAVSELVSLTQAMLEGVDADGDGRIGWQEGEGGLAQATQHLELLRRAEGLTGS